LAQAIISKHGFKEAYTTKGRSKKKYREDKYLIMSMILKQRHQETWCGFQIDKVVLTEQVAPRS